MTTRRYLPPTLYDDHRTTYLTLSPLSLPTDYLLAPLPH